MFSLEQIDPRFSPRELGTYSDNIRFTPIFLGFFVNFSERVGETQEFADRCGPDAWISMNYRALTRTVS